MANITIRNLPEATYDELKRRAKTYRRSLNQELILCLEEAAEGKRPSRGYTLEEIRRMRIKPKRPISEQFVDMAKRSGRL